MALLRRLYAKLKLCINESKGAVALATDRTFRGYGFLLSKEEKEKRAVAENALATMKERVRVLTRWTWGQRNHLVAEAAAELAARLKGMPSPRENSRVLERPDG